MELGNGMDTVDGAEAGSSRGRSPAAMGAFSGDPNAGIQVELGFIDLELMTLAQEVHKPIQPHDDRAIWLGLGVPLGIVAEVNVVEKLYATLTCGALVAAYLHDNERVTFIYSNGILTPERWRKRESCGL